MLRLFQEHIASQQICKTTDKILLAVSGGIDSMVMLHLFQVSGYRIGVAHCNFQLRGKESDQDELFVKQTCDLLHVPFFSTRFDTNNYAAENGISIQMAARDLRYAWFTEIIQQESFDLLATGHHLNDSIETVFLNLVSGRGVDGLTGIPIKNGNVIRPMLFALRTEIEEFAKEKSIAWREDSSNQTVHYGRNLVRHEVIPILRKLNTNLEQTVQRGINKNAGVLELIKLGKEAFELKHVVRTPDRTTIQKNAFSNFHHPAAVLYQLLKEHNFSLEQCEAIYRSLHGQAGKSFYSSSHQLVIDRTDLIITKNSSPVLETYIEEGQRQATSGSWKLELMEIKSVSKLNETEVVVLDAERIKYPLVWRPWKEGDYFYPLGMEHKKKISDFLIDRKVALNDKRQVMVLESDGEIFWVIGHQISNHFKITDDTTRAIQFTVSPYFI
ncbi:MAG TPA: tRNA lysidine(34) synthetase TilS [Cyclobacteriaceae bacterium]|nr:tRNA lysidine(34) synthetase TilS [Cyclobacteriaceae bacterium]